MIKGPGALPGKQKCCKYALDARPVTDRSRQSKCIACPARWQVKNQHLRNRASLAQILINDTSLIFLNSFLFWPVPWLISDRCEKPVKHPFSFLYTKNNDTKAIQNIKSKKSFGKERKNDFSCDLSVKGKFFEEIFKKISFLASLLSYK